MKALAVSAVATSLVVTLTACGTGPPAPAVSSHGPVTTIAPTPTGTERTVIDATFDDVRPGPVTPGAFALDVGPSVSADAAYDSMTFVRQGGHGGFVRTRLAAGKILGSNDSPGDGNVLPVALTDQSADAACVAYDVRFSHGFAFSSGGKLPGLLGVAPGVSPGTPTGGGSVEHGWSGRVMWLGPKIRAVRESGLPNLGITYLYHPGQAGTYGDDLSWGQGFRYADWHRVRQCYRLNTVGESDGTLRVWLDDAPVLERTDLVYRTDPAVHITHLDWSVFRGGDTLDWAADTAGEIDLDNLLVTVTD